MTKSLCWVCEREIPQDLFGPIVRTTSGDASACPKHATHKYIAAGPGKVSLIEINKDKDAKSTQ